MVSTASGSLVWLLVGSPFDPLVERIATNLRERECSCVVVQNPLTAPSRLSWHLDTASSRWSMTTPEGIEISPDKLGGVFVRHHPWVDRSGWEAADADYVQSETNAAVLAWLWALDRPVVGRMPADLWYRPQAGLAWWLPRLEGAGLRGGAVLITNADREWPSFHAEVPGPVTHRPLTIRSTWQASTDEEWVRLAAVQGEYPTVLEPAHPGLVVADVIGAEVVWQTPTARLPAVESGLLALARSASVEVLEVDIDPGTDPPTVTSVSPTISPRTPASTDVLATAVARALQPDRVAESVA
jgi:hypothetical protein